MGHAGRPSWQPCLCIAHTSTGCNSSHNSPYLWIPLSILRQRLDGMYAYALNMCSMYTNTYIHIVVTSHAPPHTSICLCLTCIRICIFMCLLEILLDVYFDIQVQCIFMYRLHKHILTAHELPLYNYSLHAFFHSKVLVWCICTSFWWNLEIFYFRISAPGFEPRIPW